MAEAHEDHGVFTDIFQRSVDGSQEGNTVRPTEKVDPEKHRHTGIQMSHQKDAPFTVADIRNWTEVNSYIVYDSRGDVRCINDRIDLFHL